MDVYAPLDTSKTYPVGVFTYGGCVRNIDRSDAHSGFVAGSKVDGQPDGLYQQLPGGFVWVVFNCACPRFCDSRTQTVSASLASPTVLV